MPTCIDIKENEISKSHTVAIIFGRITRTKTKVEFFRIAMSRSHSNASSECASDLGRNESSNGDGQSSHYRKLKDLTDEEKQAYWKRKRAEKKGRKRERTSVRREAEQAKWETLTDEEKQALKDKALLVHEARHKEKEERNAMCRSHLDNPLTPTIVFDLAFWSTMNPTGKKSTIAQLKFSFSALKKEGFSFKPVFTSFDPSEPLLVAFKNFEGFGGFPPVFYEKSIEEVYADCIESVTYLSADSANLLEKIWSPKKLLDGTASEADAPKIGEKYVIGAFVDHNSQKGATENAAKAKGIRTARLPLVETVKDIGNMCKVLTINHVTDCLTTYLKTESWEQAFSVLPTRRRTQ